MLTTSIFFLVVALFSVWNGVTSFQNYQSYTCNAAYYESPLTQTLFNPGLYWLIAAALILILTVPLFICTLRTKKQDRIGKKFPLYVAEISTLAVGLAMVFSTLFVNFNFGYYVQRNNTNNFVLEVLPIIFGGLLAIAGLALLVIQILKGLSHDFAVKVEGSRIYGFFRDYKSEMKKIVWSSKKDVFRNTLVVVVSLVIVGVLVALIDLGFTQLMLLLGAGA